jgi:methionine-S-sulfoxide reductase
VIKSIVLGGGCFWCTEAVFSILEGVEYTQPGYSGGKVENPTYENVCEGATGHTEVTKVVYDPAKITLEEILDIFFSMHDPTSLNRQGNDVGEQYRSVIFYENESDENVIKISLEENQKKFSKKIVTSVEPLKNFYPAESYHKDYFKKNPKTAYCNYVIKPKVEKVKYIHPAILKK